MRFQALFLLAAVVRGPADVESLTAAADAVVHAQVMKQKSAFGVSGGQIFTTVVLRPMETWKGEIGPQLSVLVPGGSVGELSQTVSGAAEFRDGEEVVVFLRHRTNGIYSVEQLALGKFAVGAALPGLPKRAMRDRRGLECAGCGAEQDDLSLDELRARVLASLRK
jgi:hypothetical protein